MFMSREEFIDISKRMVVEYFNRYVSNRADIPEITVDEVEEVDYTTVQNKQRALLSTGYSNLDYEVVYDDSTKQWYSHKYLKK